LTISYLRSTILQKNIMWISQIIKLKKN